MERHEVASQAYETAGLQILELCAKCLFVVCYEESAPTGASRENSRIKLHLRSRSLSPSYMKPFDVFANGGKTGDWLAALDHFRNWLIREAA